MKKITFNLDLFDVFDVTLGGVNSIITINYDLEDIASQGFNKDNLSIDSIICDDPYLINGPYDAEQVRQGVNDFFFERSTLESYFGDNISPEEYDLIEDKF